MESYWNSSYVDLSPKFNRAEASEHDINTTVTTSQVIVASYSMLFYLLLLLLSILGVWFKTCVKMVSSQATLMLFLIGTLMVFVNIFTNSDKHVVKIYFRLAGGFMVGIAFMIFGAALFFSKAEEARNQSTLEQQQPSMGFVVGAITIPLIITEVFLLASTYASKDIIESKQSRGLWILVLSDKLTFLVQKITQAIVYIILRYKTFSPRYEENAKFYLKILSFFNLVEWVDSQVNENSDVELSGAEEIYGDWFAVFSLFYKALLIDYRLLCSLLFLEHSLEDGVDGESGESNELTARNLTRTERKYRSLGFILGLTSLSAPICGALYYIPKLATPPWIHVFVIVVNLAVIGFGVLFLLYNDLSSAEKTKGFGVKIMVC